MKSFHALILSTVFITGLLVSTTYAVTETILMPDPPVEFAMFGYTMDSDGNHLLVGAHWDSTFELYGGAVYAFEYNGSEYELIQVISPDDPSMMKWFGNAVALDGNNAIIGALGDGGIGAAYVFQYNGSQWEQATKLQPDDGGVDDFFGFSVDISGLKCLIGSYWDDPKGENSGSAYLFCGHSGMWNQEKKFIPADGQVNAEFGYCCSIYDHNVVISSPKYNDNSKAWEGKIYYYQKSPQTMVWELKQEILGGEASDWFGNCLVLERVENAPDTTMRLAVGSPYYNDTIGKVDIFINYDSEFSPIEEIIPAFCSREGENEFGWSVDLDPNGHVAVGMPGYNSNGERSGAADLWIWTGENYTLAYHAEGSEVSALDNMGFNVTFNGRDLFAGAYGHDTSEINECGITYIYSGIDIPNSPPPPSTPTPSPTLTQTCTPTCTTTPTAIPTETYVKIIMPTTMFHPDDVCSCSVRIVSAEPEILPDTPLFVILDVYGEMFFAPDFTDFSFYEVDLSFGMEKTIEVLPEFKWPKDVGNADNIRFYAGLTNYEISELLGSYDMFTFGWTEEIPKH